MKILFTFSFLLFTLFHSHAQGLAVPYYTGFDNSNELEGWEQYRTGYESTYDWSVGGSGFSAPTCVSHDYNVGGNVSQTVIDWYVSPALDLSASSHLTLKVRSAGFSTPTIDNCEVYYGIGSQDPETGFFTLLLNISVATPQFEWIDFVADIPSIGDEVYIAIKYKTIGAEWMTYSIDNIQIDEVTGIEPLFASVESENTLSIFPNPAKDFLRVSLPTNSNKLEVYNLFGQLVASYSNMRNSTLIIETSTLEDGVYFIRHFGDDHKAETQRFIVQK